MRVPNPVFVGRETELGILREAFAVTGNNMPSLAFVHGKSGIGKSSLVDRFLKELSERKDLVILAGRCYERESMPYKAFDTMVDSLARYMGGLPQHEAAALTPRNAAALVQIFPVLRNVQAIGHAPKRTGPPLHQHELRRLAFGALRELLGRLSDRRPVVLCIDDLQWGDIDSAALLKELLRPPEAPALLVIGTYRDGYEGRSPLLDALRSEPSPGGDPAWRDVPVGPLTQEETRSLALQLLGRDDDGNFEEQRIESIARESEGTPYFVQELTRHSDTGTVGSRLRDSGFHGSSKRVSEFDRDAQRLLEIVAVAGRPIDQVVACRAVHVEQEWPPASGGAARGAPCAGRKRWRN